MLTELWAAPLTTAALVKTYPTLVQASEIAKRRPGPPSTSCCGALQLRKYDISMALSGKATWLRWTTCTRLRNGSMGSSTARPPPHRAEQREKCCCLLLSCIIFYVLNFFKEQWPKFTCHRRKKDMVPLCLAWKTASDEEKEGTKKKYSLRRAEIDAVRMIKAEL